MEWKWGFLVAFIVLSVTSRLTQHSAKALQYNVLIPIICISALKLVASGVLYLVFDGSPAKALRTLRDEWQLCLRYSVVAGLYGTYDVLTFVNLAVFDPQTFLLFLQLRTVVTGVIWEIAFKKELQWIQRGALVLICAACMLKQAEGGGLGDMRKPWYAYAGLAVQIIANSLAGVANEVLLKHKAGSVALNLQNVVQYFWVIVCSFAIGLLCPLKGIRFNPLDATVWKPMLSPLMLPSVVNVTVLGLVTAVILKRFDSVAKAVATGLELFATTFASAAVFGYPVFKSDGVSLCIVSLGIFFYAHPDTRLPLPLILTKGSERQPLADGKHKALEEGRPTEGR